MRRPLAFVVSLGHAEVIVELAADRADRPVADYGERGLDVHARHEAGIGIAGFIHALIDHAQADHAILLDQRLGDGHARPYLHAAGAQDLAADPEIELPERKQQAIVLVEKLRRVRQLDGLDVRAAGRSAEP